MFKGQTKFQPQGISTRWKIHYYEQGEYFKKHKDSGHKDVDKGLTSFMTVLVYLTDDEDGLEGGDTVFYGKGSHTSNKMSVKPLKGRCVFFLHQIEHESFPVLKGTKIILKSSVMLGYG